MRSTVLNVVRGWVVELLLLRSEVAGVLVNGERLRWVSVEKMAVEVDGNRVGRLVLDGVVLGGSRRRPRVAANGRRLPSMGSPEGRHR